MLRTGQRIQHLLILLLTFLGSLISPLTLKQFVYAQSPPPDPRFGAVEAFWDPTAAVEAGVGWERILFLWTELQPHGPDDWNTLHVPEEWLQAAQAQGRQVVGLLKNTPYWATDADPALEASPPRGLYLPVDDPGNLWAAFVRRTAAFYGPRGVQHWIIWNEPDILPGTYGQEWDGSVEDYYQLLKVAYLAIKQADPDASVHLAGLTFWHDHNWLRKFLAVASNDPEAPANGYFFDVASLHIYFQTNSVDYIVNEMRAALAAYGLQKPVWINETNASPDSDPLWPVTRPRWRVDLREQASFILQAGALGLASGVERIAVYKMMDVGLPAGGEPFGLLRPDHSRRPAYTAFQLMTQYYAGARSAQLYRQPLVSQVTLDRGEYTTRVFWARTGDEVSLSVPALASEALWIDQEGNAQTLDGSSGSYALTLPGARCADEVLGCIIGGPTYLLVESAPAAGLQAPLVDEPTPTLPPVTDSSTMTMTPTPTLTLAPTVTASATPSPTLPPLTDSPTMTMTPTPTLIVPTVTASATPSPTATILPSATPHPPTPTPTPSNAPGASHGQLPLVGLVLALALLTVAVLWRLRRQGSQT